MSPPNTSLKAVLGRGVPSHPVTWSAPNFEGYNDPCDDLRTLRKQKKILRKQAWALKIYKRNDDFWKLAQEHGCVFPDPEDEQKCWEVYKNFDKAKLPKDVVAFFDLMHLWAALSRLEKRLVMRVRLIHHHKFERALSRIVGDVTCFPGDVKRYLSKKFRSHAGISITKGYKKLT
ncbi:g4612 [Coccomyxa elongata]